MNLNYTIFDPTGNITILVETPVDPAFQPLYGAALLKAEPTAEQVGYLSPGDADCDIALRMAGGEFCGNATLSAAAYFAEKTGRSGRLRIRVSGAEHPLSVELAPCAEGGWCGTVEMPRVTGPEWVTLHWEGRPYVLPRMTVGGISHLVVTAPMERSFAEAVIRPWCAALGAECLGLLMLDEAQGAMTPLVYVPAGDSLYWEHSCASGTAAAGAYLAVRDGKAVDVKFTEPGGELGVIAKPDGEIFLWGRVDMVKLKQFVTD